jgi:hypothetical protein
MILLGEVLHVSFNSTNKAHQPLNISLTASNSLMWQGKSVNKKVNKLGASCIEYKRE